MRNTHNERMFSVLAPTGDMPRPVGAAEKFQNVANLAGQSILLCPGRSDINLFGYGEGIIDLNAEIPDGALNLGVAKQ